MFRLATLPPRLPPFSVSAARATACRHCPPTARARSTLAACASAPVPLPPPHPCARTPVHLRAAVRYKSRRRAPAKVETQPLSSADTSLLRDAGDPIKDGDWQCANCGYVNFATRGVCRSCKFRPRSTVERGTVRVSRFPREEALQVESFVFLGREALLVTVAKGEGRDPRERLWPVLDDPAVEEVQEGAELEGRIEEDGTLSSTRDLDGAPPPLPPPPALGSPTPIADYIHRSLATLHRPLLTGDWVCPICHVLNYSTCRVCFKCRSVSVANPAVRRFVVLGGKVPWFLFNDPSKVALHVFGALARAAGLWKGMGTGGRSWAGELWACRQCFRINRARRHTGNCPRCGFAREVSKWPDERKLLARANRGMAVGGEAPPRP
ncbi:hypothetical protein AMAG_17105 [Allomyces macrogynus ATCC 38327]|uniref:RanBP2-type domain-containing protein n=1 Tax=Allomyces macrogynus (strain ATCC 38327) TaxID=578462 RepID=A0A0L0TDH5_ALLM3|nr:hypothetical protein AMAG_17105 [Allomyces macrogynus ATCC 38327]|eukprot:KNE72777.1 hypothetical protein AMAG_17105 [Allomyces macrogynus ATCC 38327]